MGLMRHKNIRIILRMIVLASVSWASVFFVSVFWTGVSAQEAPAARVLAIVEGIKITDRDFESAYRSLPPKVQQQGVDKLYGHILELLIQQNLLVKRGREAGLAKHPKVIAQMRVFESRLVHDAFLNESVTRRITDDMVRFEYDRYLLTQPAAEEVKARHILLSSKEEALQMVGFMAEGRDFATLARQYSRGKNAPNGGDLGYFKRGEMVKEFEDIAFALQPNTYTADPVKTEFGWHIILVEDKRAAVAPTYEQLRPQLMQTLGQSVAHDFTKDLISKADVVRFDLKGNRISAPTEALPDLRNLNAQ